MTKLGVVGGGIVGASVALHAVWNGREVVVFDDADPGRATPAAAGVLQPPHFLESDLEVDPESSFAALQEASYRYYPEFLERLSGHVDGVPDWNECGGYKLAFSESSAGELKTYAQEMKKHGQPATYLTAGECQDRLPDLSPDVEAGVELPREARLDPTTLLSALREALQGDSSVTWVDRTVEAVEPTDDGVNVMLDSDREHHVDRAVVAAGYRSAELVDSYLDDVRIGPRAGEMVRLGWDGSTFSGSIHALDRHAYIRGGNLEFGATVRDEYLEEPRETAVKELTETAGGIFGINPERLTVEDAWVGHRPWINQKGGPYMGSLDEADRLWLSAGHYRTGILMGPLTGKLLIRKLIKNR